MEEADGRFGHGDASMVAHAFPEQHFCGIGHGKKVNFLLLFSREKHKEGETLGNR